MPFLKVLLSFPPMELGELTGSEHVFREKAVADSHWIMQTDFFYWEFVGLKTLRIQCESQRASHEAIDIFFDDEHHLEHFFSYLSMWSERGNIRDMYYEPKDHSFFVRYLDSPMVETAPFPMQCIAEMRYRQACLWVKEYSRIGFNKHGFVLHGCDVTTGEPVLFAMRGHFVYRFKNVIIYRVFNLPQNLP
jgi:hypothetical protein